MRRAPLVIAATVAGTAVVLSFHPQAPATKPATASTQPATGQTTTTAAAKTGASYTSAGYQASLAAALAQAGV